MISTASYGVLWVMVQCPWFVMASAVAIGFCGMYRAFTEP